MITTDRNIPLGSHVKIDVKNAVRTEAEKRKISMSEFVSRVLTDALKRLGYPLK